MDLDTGTARTAMPEITELSSVLDGLAQNPTLPDDVALRLLPYGGGLDMALRRGVTPSREVCEAFIAAGEGADLARARHLPDAIADRLAHDPDPDVRSALAHRDRPDHGRHGLFAADPDAEVRESLAQNPLVPGELLAVLAADEDPRVRRAAARAWADPPEDALRALLTDPDPRVREAAATRRPPADMGAALLADPHTRLHAVALLDLDPQTIAALAADPDEEMRRRVARHPDLGAQARDVLARDADPMVRGAVFERADTPAGLRAEIHEGLHAGYLRAQEDLGAGDEDDFLCYVALTASLTGAYPWVVADPAPYADSPYLGVRRAAAGSAALPAEARRRMLDDEDSTVRFLAFAGTAAPDPPWPRTWNGGTSGASSPAGPPTTSGSRPGRCGGSARIRPRGCACWRWGTRSCRPNSPRGWRRTGTRASDAGSRAPRIPACRSRRSCACSATPTAMSPRRRPPRRCCRRP
ncbi:hypothetical protein WKI68_11400 [Streptomyces sp. MS1.HAVA.3]|uniref:Uncharacterized protein n=1 Tax=Streptomyces caledonius TaxID=3134107 RepID=A0ABU8U200_9ACTN